MSAYIVTEGTPTAYGGRTVRIELPPQRPTCARNLRIRDGHHKGRKAAELASEFGLSKSRICGILYHRKGRA